MKRKAENEKLSDMPDFKEFMQEQEDEYDVDAHSRNLSPGEFDRK
jgi:hypothetical protein